MSSRYKYRYGIELSKEWMYSWIRVAHPICQKYQGGVWGRPFVLSPLACWLAAGLPVTQCLGAYYVGDASIHARLLVSIYMVRFLLMPTYTVPI